VEGRCDGTKLPLLGGDNVPTHGIPRSKEPPLDPKRSGDGGGGHHGRLVMDSSVFVIEIFRSQERGGWRSEEEEVCPNSKGLSVAKRSPNFLMSA
jgi:hypothetical protein